MISNTSALSASVRVVWGSLVAVVLLLLFDSVSAQDFRARITGQVTDEHKAAIEGVTVKALLIKTNQVTETKSNSDGYYSLPYLVPGTYTVEASATGFQTLKRESIVLSVAEKLNLPLQLAVGQVAQEVTVSGQEVIETGSADRGLVFDPIKTQELPLNGRQTYMLLALTPGVIFTQETFGPTGFSGTRGWDVNNAYKINGARTGQNLFLLNGAPISDNNGTWQVAPNVEAAQELQVMTNTYDSSYERFGGGVVNTTIKSETNIWNGNVFDYFRNAVFDANYSRTTRQGSQNPSTTSINMAGFSAARFARTRISSSPASKAGSRGSGFPHCRACRPTCCGTANTSMISESRSTIL